MMRFGLAALLAWPALAAAQKAVVLSKPDAEYAEPFSLVTGVRALKDGRVLVTDSKEKTVQVIDFAGRTVKVGREGSGPAEYGTPNAIAALPGDSSAVWDGGNHRYLTINPNGTPGTTFRLEPPQGLGGAGYGAFATMLPRGVDARGNIYFQGSPFVTRDGSPAPADSIPVIRFDRARQHVDTVAFVRPAKGSATVTSNPSGGVSISNGMVNPLLPLDDWAVLPDGRVAVVRGDAYRVDFYTSRGVATSGPAVQYDKMGVDNAVKQMITAQRKRQLSGGSPRTGPKGEVSNIPPDILKQLMNLEPWPPYLPPFLRGAAIARSLGAVGQIWVLRAKRSEEDPSSYDVFDASGRVVARVQLPPRTQIAGFGPETVYVLRTDDDDLQYLQRYRLPAM